MVKMFSNYQISIISHVKISYFYVCSDTTFLGGRNPCKNTAVYIIKDFFQWKAETKIQLGICVFRLFLNIPKLRNLP